MPVHRNAVVRFGDDEITLCVARELLVRLHDVQWAVTDGGDRWGTAQTRGWWLANPAPVVPPPRVARPE